MGRVAVKGQDQREQKTFDRRRLRVSREPDVSGHTVVVGGIDKLQHFITLSFSSVVCAFRPLRG